MASQEQEENYREPLGLYAKDEILPIFSKEINAEINDKFAKVKVTHTYFNPYDDYLDTSFKFPKGLYQVFDGLEAERVVQVPPARLIADLVCGRIRNAVVAVAVRLDGGRERRTRQYRSDLDRLAIGMYHDKRYPELLRRIYDDVTVRVADRNRHVGHEV